MKHKDHDYELFAAFICIMMLLLLLVQCEQATALHEISIRLIHF